MGPKENVSKKAQKKKLEKVIEDRTFGLKNKNKSKKVQDFITGVEKTVKHSNKGLEGVILSDWLFFILTTFFSSQQEKAKEAKKATKIAQQLAEEELRTLFNEGLTGQFGKKKSKSSAEAKAIGVAEPNKDLVEFLDNLSSDSDSDEEIQESSQYVVTQDDPVETAIEVYKEKTLEDIIEEQRAKLLAEGKKGTPVTAESFAKWRAMKLERKQAEAEARVKAEQSKKKGGRGLCKY